MPWLPTRIVSTVLQTRSYDAASTLFQRSAESAAVRRTAALPVSVRRNVRSGVSMLRAHAVVPDSVDSTAIAAPLSRNYETLSAAPGGRRHGRAPRRAQLVGRPARGGRAGVVR